MSKPLPVDDLNHIVQHGESALRALKHARIFITGGTGFFGVWLLESLLFANKTLDLELTITALSRHPKKFQEKFPHIAADKNIHFIEGDVRTFVFSKEKFSHIIHAATESASTLGADSPTTMLDVILSGTKHVLDFATSCDAKNILLVSSGAVYGRQPPELSHVTEEYNGSIDIQNSGNAYGIGKRTAEHMGLLYAKQYGLNIKIARCFAFVGPHLVLDAHFAIGNFIRDVLAKKDIAILGDGTPYRSYQYAADLVIWLLHILCFGENNIPYNVGSDHAVSIAETAMAVLQFFPDLKVTIAKKADPSILPQRYVPSIARAKNTLDLQNTINLHDAIRRTLNWIE